MSERVSEWDPKAIAAESRHQAAAQTEPLEVGSYVAWAVSQLGSTTGFSRVHRVGERIAGEEMTTCGELIAAPVLRIALAPGMIRSLGRCTHCEALHVKQWPSHESRFRYVGCVYDAGAEHRLPLVARRGDARWLRPDRQ